MLQKATSFQNTSNNFSDLFYFHKSAQVSNILFSIFIGFNTIVSLTKQTNKCYESNPEDVLDFENKVE